MLDVTVLGRRLANGEFGELFIEELGWDRPPRGPDLRLPVEDGEARLRPVAQKRDVPVYLHAGTLPNRQRRMRVEHELARRQPQHLIVFHDDRTGDQVWQWVKREPGRPDRVREHAWRHGDPAEGLRQKLLTLQFSLEEEETVGVTEVTRRLGRAFDADAVTKRFFRDFQARHDALKVFLRTLPEPMQGWYASVTLNRLMFVWFIQKKGFLDRSTDYLGDRLARSQREFGPNYFFRRVLSPLFFDGFATPEAERSAEHRRLLGRVPYLNGGLFQRHQIEIAHGDRIDIPDRAFEELFAFFGRWRWHLDERAAAMDGAARSGNEINPDVLGYIFEKYINQRQMGAYYTKEDVTGYICANTVLPRLLDKVAAEVPVAFRGDGSVWRVLREDPDRYIWPSVQHGSEADPIDGERVRRFRPLPLEVAAGEDDLGQREAWDRSATSDLSLPTETWREAIHRHRRCDALRQRLLRGEVANTDALVTENLNIALFVQDAVEGASEDQLKAWWQALTSLTVLDPACGSGAFLFAALNLLEPLYTRVFEAMGTAVADARRAAEIDGRPFNDARWKPLTDVLEEAARHPNQSYFILRQVALNNLHGVDLMEEATEICRLRLFLRLVAQLDDPDHVEPLPDLDFNIRAGNSLVGFASRAQLEVAIRGGRQGEMDFGGDADRIEQEAEQAALCFRLFKDQQVVLEPNPRALRETKAELHRRLATVAKLANRWLSNRYGCPPEKPRLYQAWLKSHEPFHWLTEFHDVMHAGGFDVVVGNPPYVQRSQITEYSTISYATGQAPDIYAQFIERSLDLLPASARVGLIVPISFQFSNDFASARAVVKTSVQKAWVSTFSRNPAALFSADLGVRSTIVLAKCGREARPTIRTSRLHRWIEEERPSLFEQVSYLLLPENLQATGWARLDNEGLTTLFADLAGGGQRLAAGRGIASPHVLRFKTTALYYLSVFTEDPPSFDGRGRPIAQTSVGQLQFSGNAERDGALALASTKLSLVWWAATGDDFHVTSSGLASFPISLSIFDDEERRRLANFGAQLRHEMPHHVIYTPYAGKSMGNYDIKYLRPITDEIDRYILGCLGKSEAWGAVQLAHAHFMKMTGERPGTTRADLSELEEPT